MNGSSLTIAPKSLLTIVSCQSYEPHSGTPADTKNYNLLLNDVWDALEKLGDETGKSYGLTAGCSTYVIFV